MYPAGQKVNVIPSLNHVKSCRRCREPGNPVHPYHPAGRRVGTAEGAGGGARAACRGPPWPVAAAGVDRVVQVPSSRSNPPKAINILAHGEVMMAWLSLPPSRAYAEMRAPPGRWQTSLLQCSGCLPTELGWRRAPPVRGRRGRVARRAPACSPRWVRLS